MNGRSFGKGASRKVLWTRARLRRGLRKAAQALAQQGLGSEDWALLAVALGAALVVIGGR
ncbi:MAG: hypothetical protein ACP5UM_05785 [Anaerolineae bacterium]